MKIKSTFKAAPENVYLAVAIFWGVINVFLTPPFHVPDEPAHFYRAHQVSEGTLFPEICGDSIGGTLPVSQKQFMDIWAPTVINIKQKVAFDDFANAVKLPTKTPLREFYLFHNTGFYSPITYMPQVVGITLGRILNLPLLITFYLARLCNLGIWLLLLYFAIKLRPLLKWLFVILALNPMQIFLAASMSADVLTNAVAFVFLAGILFLSFHPESKTSWKTIALLLIPAMLLAFLKNAYIPFILLWFLIPRQKFGIRSDYLKKTAVFLIFPIALYLVNAVIVNQILKSVDYENLTGNIIGMHTCSPEKQIHFILAHPIEFIKIMITSFWDARVFIVKSYTGLFGWLQYALPIVGTYFIFFVQILVALSNGNKAHTIAFRQKIVVFLVATFTIFTFSLLMYIQFNQVGSPVIINLQGRYFIPVFLLLWILFYNRAISLKDHILRPIVFISVIASMVMSFTTMLYSCYL